MRYFPLLATRKKIRTLDWIATRCEMDGAIALVEQDGHAIIAVNDCALSTTCTFDGYDADLNRVADASVETDAFDESIDCPMEVDRQ